MTNPSAAASAASRSPPVSIRDVTVAFGGAPVLKSLTLEIRPSEFLVLLGSSGCGKSTLLNTIAGLQEVDEGQVWIGGRNVTWMEPKDRGVAMVFQSYALYPRMTVRQNMSFGLKVAGTAKAEVADRVGRAADMLRIADLLDRRPSELSGGQRQRVAMGRAFVRDVGLFLFDEPLSNLDAQLRAELRVEIKRLHQRLDATMIYVTHDQVEALTLADRIAVMKGGVIQQLGTPDEVFFQPSTKYVAAFIGSPKMNVFPAEFPRDGARRAARLGGVTVPLDGYRFAEGGAEATTAELGVRPENVVVTAAPGQGYPVTVELVEPMGSETLVWARFGDQPLAILMRGGERAVVGQILRVIFPAEQLHLFDPVSGARL